MATDSILDSVKKVLSINPTDTSFDDQVILHINSVLSTLNQLGVGPSVGFMIEDNTATWTQFLGTDPTLNNIKTYVCLSARMYFDPPQTSFVIDAMEKQLLELTVRINTLREATAWVDPDPTPTPPTPPDDGWWIPY